LIPAKDVGGPNSVAGTTERIWNQGREDMVQSCSIHIWLVVWNMFLFVHNIFQWIGLRENFNRKPPYLMVKTMVSCRFSLNPMTGILGWLVVWNMFYFP